MATLDVEDALAQARAAIEQHGVVRLAALKVARADQPRLRARLAEAGFEVGRATARRPLAAQLGEALARGAFIPLKSIGAHVRGATAREAMAAARALAAAGGARLVLRTKAEVLVPSSAAVLDPAQVAELTRALKELLAQARKAAGPRARLGLLREDVAAALERALPPAGAPSPLAGLMRAIDDARDERLGLSFVPSVVRALAPPASVAAVHQQLLAAEARGLIELRPESGMGRLGPDEVALCLPGPQGARLSWVRRREAQP